MLEKKKQTPLLQLLRDVAHFEPKKGQKYVELIVTVESDDDDEYFPTVFLELCRVCCREVLWRCLLLLVVLFIVVVIVVHYYCCYCHSPLLLLFTTVIRYCHPSSHNRNLRYPQQTHQLIKQPKHLKDDTLQSPRRGRARKAPSSAAPTA